MGHFLASVAIGRMGGGRNPLRVFGVLSVAMELVDSVITCLANRHI